MYVFYGCMYVCMYVCGGGGVCMYDVMCVYDERCCVSVCDDVASNQIVCVPNFRLYPNNRSDERDLLILHTNNP